MDDGGFPPFDLTGLKTYELASRPSKVFIEDLGKPVAPEATVGDWINSLPDQLAGKSLRRAAMVLAQGAKNRTMTVAAIGGHVIKTGCSPYLIRWMEEGVIRALAMNGAAAIHDYELALAGKTSEDVGAALLAGKFGMAREVADAYSIAAKRGGEDGTGLGYALGELLRQKEKKRALAHPEASVILAARKLKIPCTIHVAVGTDIVHMHPHVGGAELGEASHIDFKRLCSVVASMKNGVWFNIGSAVIMPEVFLKAVSVVRNFSHDISGLVAINLDKESKYRSMVNVLQRPSSEGIELIGHHEVMLPLLYPAVMWARRILATEDKKKAAA
jgi:hypothetical protein